MDIDTWPSWASVCLSFIIGGITFFQLAKCWFGRTKNYEPERRPNSGDNRAKYIHQYKNGTIANGNIRKQQKPKTSKTKQQTDKNTTFETRSGAFRVAEQKNQANASVLLQTDAMMSTSAKENFLHSKETLTLRGREDEPVVTITPFISPTPSTYRNSLPSNDAGQWIIVQPENMKQKQNSKNRKERRPSQKSQRNLAILDVREMLKHTVVSSSGELGDVSSEDYTYNKDGKRKKKKTAKEHKKSVSSVIASPRIPTVEPKKKDCTFSFTVNEEGAQIKFPHAYLFLSPNSVGSDTNFKVSICHTQRKRRDDKNFRFLTPAFHIWKVDSQLGQMTDCSMLFSRKVFVRLALSSQTDEPNAKIQKTDNIKNVDWKYFAETNCSSSMQFVGFYIISLGGYRAIATPDLVPLNYILYVRRPEQHQDPDEHEFILKFWSIDIQNRDKLEVVLQEQVVNAHYGSTLTFTLSGKNVARERMEFTLPHAKQRVIKRSFSMKLKKTDSWPLMEDHRMNLTCVLSSPYIETLTNPCDFQWIKKPQQTSIELLGPGAIAMQVNNHFHGDTRSSVPNAQQRR